MTNALGIFGVMSSGKDVLGLKLLRHFYDKKPRRIIANCKLNLKSLRHNLITIDNEELYIKHKQPNFFRNSYLYITELHTILESRSSGALVNKNFTQMLTQIGKIDCKIIYTSQLIGQIDVRMREWTPYRFILKRLVYRNNQFVQPNFEDNRKLNEQIYIEINLNWTDLDGLEQYKYVGMYAPVKEDFDCFDTTEIVTLDREKFMVRR